LGPGLDARDTSSNNIPPGAGNFNGPVPVGGNNFNPNAGNFNGPVPVGNNRVGAGNFNNPVPVGGNNIHPSAGNFNNPVPVDNNNNNNNNNPGFAPGFVAGPVAAGNVPAGGFNHGHGISARDAAGDDIDEDEGGDPIATRDSAGNDEKDPYLKSLHGHPLDTRDAAGCLIARDGFPSDWKTKIQTDCFGMAKYYTGRGRHMARDEYGGGKGDKGDKFSWPKLTFSQDTKDRGRDAWDSVLGHVKMAREEDGGGKGDKFSWPGISQGTKDQVGAALGHALGHLKMARDEDGGGEGGKGDRFSFPTITKDQIGVALGGGIPGGLGHWHMPRDEDGEESARRPARAGRGVIPVGRDRHPENWRNADSGHDDNNNNSKRRRDVVDAKDEDDVDPEALENAVREVLSEYLGDPEDTRRPARAVRDVVARDEDDPGDKTNIAKDAAIDIFKSWLGRPGKTRRLARAAGGVVVARGGNNNTAAAGGSNSVTTHARHAQKEIALGPLHSPLLVARGNNATAPPTKNGTTRPDGGKAQGKTVFKAQHRAARRDPIVPPEYAELPSPASTPRALLLSIRALEASAPPIKDAITTSSTTVTQVAASPTTSSSSSSAVKKNAGEGSGLGSIARALGVGGAALAVAIAIL